MVEDTHPVPYRLAVKAAYRSLLEIARVLHGFSHDLLALGKRVLDRNLPRDGGRNLLRNVRAESLEFRNAYKLDTRVRDLILGRVRRVSRLDGLQSDSGECASGLQVFRVLVGGLAGAGWHGLPTIGFTHQFDVIFAG